MTALVKRSWLLLLLMAAGFASGCATTDRDTMAERPWDAPKNWEYGLPPSLMEGR
jgi:hypothetical protein